MGVTRQSLGRWVDPATAWSSLLRDAPNSFWLDGSGTGISYLGAGSTVLDDLPDVPLGVGDSDLGWVGWIGYPPEPTAFIAVDWCLAFDHSTGEVVASGIAVAAIIAALDGAGAEPAGGASAHDVSWAHSDADYLAMIAECQRRIADGDAYQLCLTTTATVAGDFDPFATYLTLREFSPSHHGGLIRIGDTALLSASPEQFLTVSSSGLIASKPIKGTRARSFDATEDAAQANELLTSDKERAENLMIVDLMRNDIGRVSVVGSIAVPSLLVVESYSNVHQLVSTVTGQLLPGLTASDVVASTFPAGSMTGAPKASAISILAGLEGRPRGIYSGAFGYFARDGSADLAMTIRSIVVRPGVATVGAGGGITALSVPEEELAEVRLKAAPLLRALGAAHPDQ